MAQTRYWWSVTINIKDVCLHLVAHQVFRSLQLHRGWADRSASSLQQEQQALSGAVNKLALKLQMKHRIKSCISMFLPQDGSEAFLLSFSLTWLKKGSVTEIKGTFFFLKYLPKKKKRKTHCGEQWQTGQDRKMCIRLTGGWTILCCWKGLWQGLNNGDTPPQQTLSGSLHPWCVTTQWAQKNFNGSEMSVTFLRVCAGNMCMVTSCPFASASSVITTSASRRFHVDLHKQVDDRNESGGVVAKNKPSVNEFIWFVCVCEFLCECVCTGRSIPQMSWWQTLILNVLAASLWLEQTL